MLRRNILIIEDELIIAADIERILLNQNWNVCGICNHADEAYELITLNNPNLVLIDIMLKGKKEGIQIGKYLSEEMHIPFIYITSLVDSNTLQEVKETLPGGYIVKPFKPSDIITTVEIAFANHHYKTLGPVRQADKPISEIPLRVREVLLHIQKNLDKKIRLEELAQMTGWNTYHFIRNFKKYVGTTPYRYLLQYRIKKAKKLLVESNLPISEIAIELGFSNHSNFSTTFLKLEKSTPEEYRKKYRWTS